MLLNNQPPMHRAAPRTQNFPARVPRSRTPSVDVHTPVSDDKQEGGINCPIDIYSFRGYRACQEEDVL